MEFAFSMTADVIIPLLRDLLFGYLLGSIPSGFILAKLAGQGDLRQVGSGNIGATNVLRTGKISLAVLTLLFDTLKGTSAVVCAQYFESSGNLKMLPEFFSGLGAFLGHLFPVWLGFKGGKGVATYIGVLIGVSWSATGIFCGVWLIIAFVTRISSLSALIASVVTPTYLFLDGHLQQALFFGFLSILLIWKHIPNIERLIAAKEPRIGKKQV